MAGGHLWSLIANLAFVASPIIAIMLLDYFRKDRRGWRYYLLAFALVVVVDILIIAIEFAWAMVSQRHPLP